MNYWEEKFRHDSDGGAEFGTFMGNHTVQELKDLIAAKDVDMAQLNKQQSDFSHLWLQQDQPTADTWLGELVALNNRYDAAKAAANSYMNLSAVDLSAIGSEAAYNKILDALNPSWRQNTPAPGSYGDLYNRITQAGAKFQAWVTPQPTPNSDIDLNVFKAANAATKTIEHAASTGASYLPWVIAAILGLAAVVVVKR